MKRGTILYIGGFELPDKNAAAHRVLSNAKILRALTYEVVLIDVNKDLPSKSRITNTKKDTQGFDSWSLSYPKSTKQWIEYLSNINPIIEVLKLYPNVNAVICYNYPAVALLKLKAYCNRQNIKIIADCTEWYSSSGMNIISKLVKEFDTFFRMRVVHKRTDGIIVISRFLENYYKNCKNVVRIPPLVDLTEEKWNEVKQRYDDGLIRLVYAGDIGRNKDKLDRVLENLFELEGLLNYELRIIGITKKQYLEHKPTHRTLIGNMEKKVFFIGRISHTESLSYVKSADFMIFFREDNRTTRAGFPTKFVESVTCGTPIITNFSSDLADYMQENVNCISVNMSDINLLEGSIKKIRDFSRLDLSKTQQSIINESPFEYHKYIDAFDKFMRQCIP